MLHTLNRFSSLHVPYSSYHMRFSATRVRGGKSIQEHFVKNDGTSTLNLFPTNLKRITTKKNQTLYIADQNVAALIANKISQHRIQNVPFVEIDPGPCILTQELIRQMDLKEIRLIHNNEEFLHIQKELEESLKPDILIKSKIIEWFYRVNTDNFFCQLCEKRQWNDDIICQLYINFESQYMFRIIMDAIYQRGYFINGRTEIFATMESLEFMKLTACPDSTYLLYTQKSCVFQILFEYEILAEIKNECFLPWKKTKPGFGGRVDYDGNMLYLVRITPRKDLFSLCERGDLPLLRFFIDQCFFKRRSDIIPKLEQWIPGIGAELIIGSLDRQLSMNDTNDDSILNNFNIKFDAFTKCGSLTPFQMCALFRFLQMSPQYKTSCFHEQFNNICASKVPKDQKNRRIRKR